MILKDTTCVNCWWNLLNVTSLANDWGKSMKLLTHLSGYFQYKHCSLHIHVWLFIEGGAMSLLMSKHAKCLTWVQLCVVDRTLYAKQFCCPITGVVHWWLKAAVKPGSFHQSYSLVKVEHSHPSSVSLIHLKSYRNRLAVFVLFVLYKRDTCKNVSILQKQMNCC